MLCTKVDAIAVLFQGQDRSSVLGQPQSGSPIVDFYADAGPKGYDIGGIEAACAFWKVPVMMRHNVATHDGARAPMVLKGRLIS
jgi:hypothetical protein